MQQRNQKSDEPSMEDILASIRKIISEEPATTAGMPAVPPAGSATAAMAQRQTTQVPPAAAPTSSRPEAQVTPPMPAVAVEPSAEHKSAATPPMSRSVLAGSRLSDIVRELAPSAIPVGSTGPAMTTLTFHDDLSDLVETEAPAPVARSKPVVPPVAPAVARNSMSAPVLPDLAPPKSDRTEAVLVEKPAPLARTEPELRMVDRVADFGSFIPSTAEAIASTPARTVSVPFGTELKVSETVKSSATSARTLGLGVPSLEQVQPAAPVAGPEPAAAKREPNDRVIDLPEPEAHLDRVADPVSAAQSALGALAVGLASSTAPLVDHSSGMPQVVGSDVATIGAAVLTGTPIDFPARRSLDDTIVDMLRPLIREWLDANLPEMVEKALRQELSDRSGGER